MHHLQRKYKTMICELVETSVRLGTLGYVTSHGGNLSSRVGDDRVIITPTGFSKKKLTFNDIVIINLEGEVLFAKNGIRFSIETPTHLRIFKKRPDINGIIHAHPPILTGFALTGVNILSRPIHPEAITEIGPMLDIEYKVPTSEELLIQFDRVIQKANAFLMKNHGVMICSPVSVENALDSLEMLESTAYSIWIGMTVGNVNEITKDEIDNLEKIRKIRNFPLPGAPGVNKKLRDLYY